MITDQDNLVDVYRNSFPAAALVVKRLGGTLEEAKDAFHDALLIYMERLAAGKLNIQTSAKAYLIGITKIVWLHSKNQHFTALPKDVENFIVEEDEENEEEKNVLDYLVIAGQKCMEMLKAFYYDNISLQQIARRFGFNGTRSATVQKHKCIEKIRTVVKKNEMV